MSSIRTLFTQRQAPGGNQWQEALHAALVDKLTAQIIVGVGSYAPTNQIIVYLTKFADGDDENAALQIVASHDTELRTDEQLVAAATPTDKERIATLEAAILEMLEGGL